MRLISFKDLDTIIQIFITYNDDQILKISEFFH